MATLVKKKTVSLKPNLYKKLQNSSVRNKSWIVNNALDMYFRKEEMLQNSEKEFWQKEINKAQKDFKNWDHYTINPNNEKIDDDLLEQNLWSKVDE